MSEDQLLTAVLGLCRTLHLHVAHFRPAQAKSGRWLTAVQGDGKGYPDLTIAGPGGVMWRELKTDRGVLRPEQKVWIARLVESSADAAVWKPRDLQSGRIAGELQALARTRMAVA
jgi:hypothetical protein